MKTFLLTACLLLSAPIYGQMASLTVTSDNSAMVCGVKTLTFDAHDPDGIYSVTVQTKKVFNLQDVYQYKRLPGEVGVVDSSFSIEVVCNLNRYMEYKLILKTKDGLIVIVNDSFINDIPTPAAHLRQYANTFKFTNYYKDCQPVKVGAMMIPHFIGSCDQYASSYDTTMVTTPGELVITIWGDDPATPSIDGFQDGDGITMFDLSENVYNEFRTEFKFDAKRNIDDTVFSVGESASGLNYLPGFNPYTRKYDFGTVSQPTTKQIIYSNTSCNKSLQPKIVGIQYLDASEVNYSHKITSDTTFEMTYSGKGEGSLSVMVQYEYIPGSTVILEKMFSFKACSGDHQVDIFVKDERGLAVLENSYLGIDPSVIKLGTLDDNKLMIGVLDGWTSSVTVTHPKYRMVPSAISINNLNKDTVLNFVAMYDGNYGVTIQPFVGYATIHNVTTAPVVYNVNGKIVPSNSIGQYIDSLPARWSGFIVPVVKDYTFDTLKVASLLSDNTFQIKGAYTGTYTLSGVCNSKIGGIAGVMVVAGTDTAYTDNVGLFSFQKPVGWSGKLAISKHDYTFVNPTGDYIVSPLTGPKSDYLFYGGESQISFFDLGIKYRMENDKNIDTNGDGAIQVYEARAYTGRLNFSNLGNPIDVLALSYFVNIEILEVTRCSFTSIDLSPFAQLSGLIAGKSDLEFLDISSNPELQFVYTTGSADLAVICGGSVHVQYTKDPHTTISASCSNLFTQSITLNAGWNMISINVIPADNSISSLFAGLNVGEIKTMDTYWRVGQPDMFNSLHAIAAGEGYLVNMKAAGELKLTGTPLVAINYLRDKSQSWKLIGTPFQSPTDFSELYNMTNCSEIKNFDGFWQPLGTQKNMTQFEPGKAYFVR